LNNLIKKINPKLLIIIRAQEQQLFRNHDLLITFVKTILVFLEPSKFTFLTPKTLIYVIREEKKKYLTNMYIGIRGNSE
jgi:hypothetical protein